MIEKYRIDVVNGKATLFLFLNLNYEFGGKEGKKSNFKKEITHYIRKNRIPFKEGIITFVVGGVLIGNVLFNNSEFKDYHSVNDAETYVSEVLVKQLEKVNDEVNDDKKNEERETQEVKTIKSEKKENNIFQVNHIENNKANNNVSKEKTIVQVNNENNSAISNDNTNADNDKQDDITEVNEVDNNFYVNLVRKNGMITKIEIEEYLVGVVGAEMPALFNIEALKAQAIIARTYAVKNTLKGNNLRDNESNQTYKANEELKSMWGGNYNTYYNKVKLAVDETEGMVLKYNGAYIEAVYHSTSNGMTESSVNVWGNYYPYLVNVDSKYDNSNVSFSMTKEFSFDEISNKLGFEVNKETNFIINRKTSGNRVENITVGENTYKGIDFRNLLGLRSADFDFEITDNGVKFTTRGYGHGVGLSQYGANGMAKNGYNYEQILKHYYPGVLLDKMG